MDLVFFIFIIGLGLVTLWTIETPEDERNNN